MPLGCSFRYRWNRKSKLVSIIFAVLVVAAITAVVAILVLASKWKKTVEISMRPNTTQAISSFNGDMIGKVAGEVTHLQYQNYTRIYAFWRMPPLDVHRDTTVCKRVARRPIYSDNFVADKFHLNRGSQMNVSFCVDSGARVLVLETGQYLEDLNYAWIPKTVRLNKTFNASDCQSGNATSGEFTFTSDVSSTYQFVWMLWNSSELSLSNTVYKGDMTQYNVNDSASYCSPRSDSLKCSIDMPNSGQAVVIVDVGNVSIPEQTDFVMITLRSTVRSSLQRFVGMGVAIGVVVVIAFPVGLFMWNTKQSVEYTHLTDSD